MPILTAFIEAAMHEAKYKIFEDGTFFERYLLVPGYGQTKKPRMSVAMC